MYCYFISQQNKVNIDNQENLTHS